MKKRSIFISIIIFTLFLFFNIKEANASSIEKEFNSYGFVKGYPPKLKGIWVSEYLTTGYSNPQKRYARHVFYNPSGKKTTFEIFFYNKNKKMTGYDDSPSVLSYPHYGKSGNQYGMFFGTSQDDSADYMLLMRFYGSNKMAYKYVIHEGEKYHGHWFVATKYNSKNDASEALNEY